MGGASKMAALQKKLLQDYNPLVRPSLNYSVPTDVSITLFPVTILGLDTKQQVLYTRAFLNMEWIDELLQWDPKLFGGIKRIVANHRKIWKPNILLYNAASDKDKIGDDNVHVRVNYAGIVRWDPTFYLESTCKLDVSKYPFDVTVCSINVESWVYDNTTCVMRWPENPINFKYMLVNGEFEISSAGATKYVSAYEGLFFEGIKFKISLARRSAYIVISLLIPVNLLAVLSILSFLMPTDEPEKVNLSVNILLSFTVFLSFVDNNVPRNSDNISLLVIYIAALLLMSFLSVVGNILVVAAQSWHVSVKPDHTHVCGTKNRKQQPTTETVADTTKLEFNSNDGRGLTEGEMVDLFHSGSFPKLPTVSDKRKHTYKTSRKLADKLNKAFFAISSITFVFISSLMCSLIISA